MLCVYRPPFLRCADTIVIGTSSVVFQSAGGSKSLSSLPLGGFFSGSSLISFGVTEPLFRKAGRKAGFLTGCALGLIATALGICGLLFKSTVLTIVSSLAFGTANGLGFYLRFAALELVPEVWQARALTLVVSGGVLSAFAGPETGQATAGIFGSEENLTYMGVYTMTGIFNLASILCLWAVEFKNEDREEKDAEKASPETAPESNVGKGGDTSSLTSMYKSLLATRSFVVPMLISALSWAIMAIPMSILRVAMKDAGFTSRQSLLGVELHFLGMYAPGFVTGTLIQRLGIRNVIKIGFAFFCVSVALNLTSETEEEGTMVTWFLGMMGLGIGWNFCFTASTVWLTKTVDDVSYTKGQVQAANDSLMFLISGVGVFSASYIYGSRFLGSGVLSGWMTLHYCIVILVTLCFLVIVSDYYHERQQRQRSPPIDINGAVIDAVDDDGDLSRAWNGDARVEI
jgi:MFS family permease